MENKGIRDMIGKEVKTIRKLLDERPKCFSKDGIASWNGRIDGLNWVLSEMAEEGEGIVDNAIAEYKERINSIPSVLLAYTKQTTPLSLWALVDKEKIKDTLSKVVQIEIDLHNKYPSIDFDFRVNPLIDKNELDTENWTPLKVETELEGEE